MSILLTSFLISLIAALWVWMAGRRDPHGRPWLTVLCLGMLLVLPLLTLLPKFQWEVLGVVSGASRAAGSESHVWSWTIGVWLFGAFVMLVRMIRGQRILAKWLADSREMNDTEWLRCMDSSASMLGLENVPPVRLKEQLSSPVVAGLLKPVILMPSAARLWSIETRKMAILHELGHIQRKDLWVRLAADTTCALHWYNPLVWWMRAKLLTQCEYACDARVIASGANPKSYISALCDVVESAMQESREMVRPAGVCAMADHAPLKMRVKRLLREQRVGSPWLAVAAAVLTTVTALGLTLVRPVIERSEVAIDGGKEAYSQEEIDLRHSANPFPGN